MGEFVSYPKFVSPATKTLHPDTHGVKLTLDELILALLKLGTNPAASGLIRMANNELIKARNAGNNADITLLGTDSSDHLLLGSGLTGILKAVSSVVSASGIVNADVDAAAAIAMSKLALSITNSEVNASAAIAASKIAAGGGTFAGSGTATFPGGVQPVGPYTLIGGSTAFSTATSIFSFTAASGGGLLFVALAGNTQGAAFSFDGAGIYKLGGHANWVAGIPGSGQRGVKLFTNFIQLEDGDGISRTGNWIALVG